MEVLVKHLVQFTYSINVRFVISLYLYCVKRGNSENSQSIKENFYEEKVMQIVHKFYEERVE